MPANQLIELFNLFYKEIDNSLEKSSETLKQIRDHLKTLNISGKKDSLSSPNKMFLEEAIDLVCMKIWQERLKKEKPWDSKGVSLQTWIINELRKNCLDLMKVKHRGNKEV